MGHIMLRKKRVQAGFGLNPFLLDNADSRKNRKNKFHATKKIGLNPDFSEVVHLFFKAIQSLPQSLKKIAPVFFAVFA